MLQKVQRLARRTLAVVGWSKGHAEPFTLVEVLAFLMAFPGFFVEWDVTGCELEDILKFLVWSWVDVVIDSVVWRCLVLF